MKFSDLSFPHPVLGISDSISGNADIGESEINKTSNNYEFSLELNFNNKDLEQLVNENKAEFICEVTCSNTLFRHSFKSNSNRIEFAILNKLVRGRIDFICLLVAKSEINNYTNSLAHSDYDGYSFNLVEGDVLAYFGEFSFNADVKYEKLKAVSSFMEVVEKPDLEYTNIDLKKSKIQVELPSQAYNSFRSSSISQEYRFVPIFHSSIVMNALLIALYNYNDHQEYIWAQVIEYRLRNEDELKHLSIDEKANIPEIAQILLGNPFNRLLNEGLNTLTESMNSYEN